MDDRKVNGGPDKRVPPTQVGPIHELPLPGVRFRGCGKTSPTARWWRLKPSPKSGD